MIHKLFATPIYHQNLNDENLRRAIEAKVCSSQRVEYQHPNPPQGEFRGVFESRFNFLSETSDPAIRQLAVQIDAHLNALIAVLTGAKPEEIDMRKLGCESWFHVTTEGGYFQPHHHPNATWSVVYCVSSGLPKGIENEAGSGHLIFMDPRSASMFLDEHSRKLHRDISFDGVKYLLADGDIVIFPSYLQHYVSPYHGGSKRITIAANFWGPHRSD